MALAGDEIRQRLKEFAASWGGYQGSERAEAQTFLTELLACYGVDRKGVGAVFEDRVGSGFMDMLWPGVCLVEMKRPSEAPRLEVHREQAFEYWKGVGRPGAPAPPYVVLCAFHRFEVYKPDEGWVEPLSDFELSELPEYWEALAFLAGRSPSFESQAALTREAVELVAELYRRLDRRLEDRKELARDFVLQSVWALFAEDLGMLGGRMFTNLLDELIAHPERSSADDLGLLFEHLATPGERPQHGLYAGVPYVDGGLFERPARAHLDAEELELLRGAARFDWTRVEPAIFGSLLEGALGKERQWALGAHYTHEADILKVVLPTVVEPWRERIAACASVADCEAAERDLMEYVVLDPACGSGNFLYVAYRHLRRIEAALRAREAELRRASGLAPRGSPLRYFPLSNMRGIEIEPFAVSLARVTLWMGHKLAVDELGLDEPVLPLADLSGIQLGDALRIKWPRADAIIGNPPYIGTKSMRSRMGDEYLDFLSDRFAVGVKDLCVYWFRKAAAVLEPGARAGLVATNSIREGRNREASLDYIVDTGGVIVDAISSEPWSGAANVHVSIVNWVDQPIAPPTVFRLDGREVDGITSQLRIPAEGTIGDLLPANAGKQFFGVVPSGEGFILGEEEAEALIARSDADYRRVVRPYLVGDDITKRPGSRPSRWIIDFGELSLEEAMTWPDALQIVRERVKPGRDGHRKKREREEWWKFSRTVRDLFEAVEALPRFACPATAKSFFMVGASLIGVWAMRPAHSRSTATTRWEFLVQPSISVGLLTHRRSSRLALVTRPRPSRPSPGRNRRNPSATRSPTCRAA